MVTSLFRKARQQLRPAKVEFGKICASSSLPLSFDINRSGISIFHDIFISREYANYFPFYEKSVIVDVGAHYGYFTMFSSKNSAGESTVIAIEPSLTNYEILSRNIKDSGLDNVRILNMALSDTRGKQDFYGDKSHNYSLYSQDNNPLSTNSANRVETLTLEDVFQRYSLPKIDFLKLDCEGAEYNIILNANPETLSKIKTISMEFHDLKDKAYTGLKLVECLEKFGFKIVKFEYMPTNMDLNFGKIIAIRQSD